MLGFAVGQIMGQHPLSWSADRTLPAVARLLHEGNMQRLFLFDDARCPIGVLSRGDGVRALTAAG